LESSKLHDWLEIVGIFSVVASLVFVGLEMRQAHEISLSQAYQSRVASVVEWNLALAANPAALSARRKSAAGTSEEIGDQELDAYKQTLIALFHLYDNAHLQHQKGFVSDEFWEMTRASLKLQMKDSIANSVFLEKASVRARPAFRDVVLSISEELQAEFDDQR
jgi:hypothetical protein